MDSIREGDLLPDSYVYEEYPTNKISVRELVNDRRIVLLGFIGAFVPVCSRNFLPDYIEKVDAIKQELEVEEICAVAVQDAFVLQAFNKCVNRDCKIRFLADQDASFVRAMGLSFDAPVLSSVRSKRFSMIVDNGTVCELNVEPDFIGLTCSTAEKLGKEKPPKVAYPALKAALMNNNNNNNTGGDEGEGNPNMPPKPGNISKDTGSNENASQPPSRIGSKQGSIKEGFKESPKGSPKASPKTSPKTSPKGSRTGSLIKTETAD